MKCNPCRRRLLAAENPETPTPEVLAHLQKCEDCRRWQRRLLRVERHVPTLPVPPSAHAKEQLLAKLLATAPAAATRDAGEQRPDAALPLPWWRRPPARRVGVAAAAAVLITCGVFLGRQFVRQPRTPDTQQIAKEPSPALPAQALVARALECDLRLAETAAPRERVEALADLADALHQETRALSHTAAADDLHLLAQLYEKVVRDGVVPRAKAVPAGQRRQVLDPIAARLVQAEKEARRLASGSTPSASSLTQIAAAARSADTQLRALMEEAR